MIPCISQTCTLSTSFADDVTAYADGGCAAVEAWLTKLETHLEKSSVADTRKLLEDRGVSLVAAAYQGGLLLSQGEQRKAHFDHYKRRLDLCQAFGIGTLLVVADFVDRLEQTDLERAVVSLRQAGQWAQAFSVRLGLEFRGRNTFCSNLATCQALVQATGEPNVGVCLDVFHYYTGPSKFEDLGPLTPQTLAHVQVCDVAGVARELASDADRIFPGEGDFHLGPIVERLRAIGYTGAVSLELLSPELWRARPSQVADLGMASLRRLLGQEK